MPKNGFTLVGVGDLGLWVLELGLVLVPLLFPVCGPVRGPVNGPVFGRVLGLVLGPVLRCWVFGGDVVAWGPCVGIWALGLRFWLHGVWVICAGS